MAAREYIKPRWGRGFRLERGV